MKAHVRKCDRFLFDLPDLASRLRTGKATMAETLAERRRRDEQVRATINQKLVDTGEKERCVLRRAAGAVTRRRRLIYVVQAQGVASREAGPIRLVRRPEEPLQRCGHVSIRVGCVCATVTPRRLPHQR